MRQPVMVGAAPTEADLEAIDSEPGFSPLDDDAYPFLEHLPGVNWWPSNRGFTFVHSGDDNPDDDLPIIGGDLVA